MQTSTNSCTFTRGKPKKRVFLALKLQQVKLTNVILTIFSLFTLHVHMLGLLSTSELSFLYFYVTG